MAQQIVAHGSHDAGATLPLQLSNSYRINYDNAVLRKNLGQTSGLWGEAWNTGEASRWKDGKMKAVSVSGS